MPQDKSKHSVVAIVQARMGSTRLPNKVLMLLAGQAVLWHIVQRLACVANLDRVVVATTHAEQDLPIIEFCEDHGIESFAYSGAEDDLLGRYIQCGECYDADIIVMVDGDCPLLHPPSIERMVAALAADSDAEYARLDPCSIEGGVAVLRLSTYRKMARLSQEASHREHATLYLMENPQQFAIVSVPCETDFRDIKHRLWLDTPADYAFLSEVYRRLYSPGGIVDLHAVVALLRSDATLRELNAHVGQKDVRARVETLWLEVNQVTPEHMATATRLAALLVERYQLGLKVLASGLSEAQIEHWQAAMFTLWPGPPSVGDGLLCLDASTEVLRIKPAAEQGAPRLCLGLATTSNVEQLVEWVSCYLGVTGSHLGHYEPIVHTSDGAANLETVPCPLCGSGDCDELWRHENGVSNAICRACGHVYLVRRPTQAVIQAAYADFQQNYSEDYLLGEDSPTRSLARFRFQALQQVRPAAVQSVLEVGCAYGHFLSQFSTENLRVGIEPSQTQARFAREKFQIAEVWQCAYERLMATPPSWPTQGFDVACAFHILEHVRQPREFLRFMKRNLRDSGVLCLAVPNLHTLSTDLIELYFLCRGLHLHTFSPEGLKRLLLEEGFEVLAVHDEDANAMLRSSVLLVARSVSRSQPATVAPVDICALRVAATRFHHNLSNRLRHLQTVFADWYAAGHRICVYGAGIHTRALLELAGIRPQWLQAIVDDDPEKQGTLLHGVPVFDLETVLQGQPTCIVVSSLASEEALLARLKHELPEMIELLGIYNDLMGDE